MFRLFGYTLMSAALRCVPATLTLALMVFAVAWPRHADAAPRTTIGIDKAGDELCGDAYVDCWAACSFIPSDSQANDFAFNTCVVACDNAWDACREQAKATPLPKNWGGVKTPVGAEPPATTTGGSNAGRKGAASRLNVAGLNVMLSCQIANWKVIVITNSTGAAIAAGTKISYDAIRSGGNEHYGETLNGPLLPPGASIQRGGSESSSCTAWFRKPMLLSPQ